MNRQKCEWHKCNRPATRYRGWDSMACCDGHAMLGQFNKDSYGYEDLPEDQQNRMLVHGLTIRQWFRDNPNPQEEVEQTST